MEKEKQLDSQARLKAGISQMRTYGSNQYLMWRIVAVKSMKKILLNLDDFYSDLISDIELSDETDQDIVHNQIRNGWLYEAVSQAEQSIEDVFSLLRNATDLTYFARNVVNYKANEISRYIKDFQTSDIEYVLEQFGIPYFPLDEPWENVEIFEQYKTSVMLMSKYLEEMKKFHKKYYQDYCQYKHGMAVGLKPFGTEHMKADPEWNECLNENPLQGALFTFDNYSVEKRQRISGRLPQLALYLTEDVQPFITEFEKENNLLSYSLHVIDVEKVVSVTEHAVNLLFIIWENLNALAERKDEDKFIKCFFPTENFEQNCVIHFPK